MQTQNTTVTALINSGYDMRNIPQSISQVKSLITSGAISTIDLTSLSKFKLLDSIGVNTLDIQWNKAINTGDDNRIYNCDCILMETPTERQFYHIMGITRINNGMLRLLLARDNVTTIGLDNINFIGKLVRGHETTRDWIFDNIYDEPLNNSEPVQELVDHFDIYQYQAPQTTADGLMIDLTDTSEPQPSSAYYMTPLLTSQLDLNGMGVLRATGTSSTTTYNGVRDGATYTPATYYVDPNGNYNAIPTTVPSPVDTNVVIVYPDTQKNMIQQGATTYNLNSVWGSATLSQGLMSVRQTSNQNMLTASYQVPTALINTTASSFANGYYSTLASNAIYVNTRFSLVNTNDVDNQGNVLAQIYNMKSYIYGVSFSLMPIANPTDSISVNVREISESVLDVTSMNDPSQNNNGDIRYVQQNPRRKLLLDLFANLSAVGNISLRFYQFNYIDPWFPPSPVTTTPKALAGTYLVGTVSNGGWLAQALALFGSDTAYQAMGSNFFAQNRNTVTQNGIQGQIQGAGMVLAGNKAQLTSAEQYWDDQQGTIYNSLAYNQSANRNNADISIHNNALLSEFTRSAVNITLNGTAGASSAAGAFTAGMTATGAHGGISGIINRASNFASSAWNETTSEINTYATPFSELTRTQQSIQNGIAQTSYSQSVNSANNALRNARAGYQIDQGNYTSQMAQLNMQSGLSNLSARESEYMTQLNLRTNAYASLFNPTLSTASFYNGTFKISKFQPRLKDMLLFDRHFNKFGYTQNKNVYYGYTSSQIPDNKNFEQWSYTKRQNYCYGQFEIFELELNANYTNGAVGFNVAVREDIKNRLYGGVRIWNVKPSPLYYYQANPITS